MKLPEPYYQDSHCTIYHGDCREIMPSINTDLVIADPPYNAGLSYGDGTNDSMSWVDYTRWLSICIELMEASSSGPVFVFLSVNGLLALVPVRCPRHVCVWNKPMSFSARLGGSPFLPHWEPCAVFGKVHGIGGRVPDWYLSDVWSHNTAPRNGHPCPKPESLLTQIIAASPAETVLDPFMGSGTTLRAAKDLGRRAIGIDIEERYCEIAARRLAQEVLAL